ncbi:MAG: rhodanese-related sulfurtransferase [Zoogloeaceae bacterium]|jgi:rhodanese-related sulfurtransferase|nr:rhodanese-related sulfurtransferase [Zoogloeaceae bacterium]
MSAARIASAEVRAALLERREIALIDVREEAPHAEGHPLFAAQISRSRLELEVFARLPRRDVPIVTLDDTGAAGGRAERAAEKLAELGYTHVAVLAGGVFGQGGWRDSGGEIFRDVNVPSKAFGELVDATLKTPSLAAEAVQTLLDAKEDVLIVDVRRFDEYQTMNIPGSISVPGAELALRVPVLAPDPKTRVIVNCAGRTRSIIGTQSLINWGLANPVAALRNGTIGWTLAGQTLEHQQNRNFPAIVPEALRQRAAEKAAALARRAGARLIDHAGIAAFLADTTRTTYCIDVRDPAEYQAGHRPGFQNVPGGQLVQETEMTLSVRGARVVLSDTDGVRAPMTASWLAQMAWEVYTCRETEAAALTETGAWRPPLPPLPDVPNISPATLAEWLASDTPPAILDFTRHQSYRQGHIPGAWFALRADLAQALAAIPKAGRYVLTCLSGLLGHYAHAEAQALLPDAEVFVLAGGTNAWVAAGLPLATEEKLATPASDRYQRPYEGTQASPAAMQAYLDWEYGLVAQLERDGSHHFQVLKPCVT